MLVADTVKIQNGYKIRGIEPPDLKDYDQSTRKLYWSWVVEFGLKRKDRELSQGLDKDGKPLRPITAATRKHRRSAMTPSGKGDPGAPPLTPALQKSRTRSLLAGKAVSTHADFFWKYDAYTGASWAVVLSYQADRGRDVFGLSQAGIAAVKAQSWAKWARWKQGKVRTAPKAKVTFPREEGTTGTTPEERRQYFSQTARAVLPGRPARPKEQSPIVGPDYTRLLQHVWGGQTFPGRGGAGPRGMPIGPKAPPRPAPRPAPKPPAPRQTLPPIITRPQAPPRQAFPPRNWRQYVPTFVSIGQAIADLLKWFGGKT